MELKSLAPYGKPSIEGSEHMNTSELSPAQESITGSWDNSCLWSFSLCIWTLPMFCLFAFHSHFLLFIKIAIKLFVLMLQHNCQLHCQHTSSWYQWDTVRCFHLFNFFFFLMIVSTWNLVNEIHAKLQKNLVEPYLCVWIICWLVWKFKKTMFRIVTFTTSLNLRYSFIKKIILNVKFEELQLSYCAIQA